MPLYQHNLFITLENISMQVNKLIRNGANILAPIIVSDEHPPGTVVDYAYSVFQQVLYNIHLAFNHYA